MIGFTSQKMQLNDQLFFANQLFWFSFRTCRPQVAVTLLTISLIWILRIRLSNTVNFSGALNDSSLKLKLLSLLLEVLI